jgi:endonuclease-3
MTEGKRAQQILRILRREFSLPDWVNAPKEPFSTLIRTILSQATNDKNRDKAFRNLSEKFEMTPKVLAEANVKEIEKAIRIGGLYRNIVERFDGKLDFVFSLPLGEARKLLMALPGIGPKTADVVLLFSANRAVLPVDTHVNRVSKRLGLVAPNADYERIRLALESFYSPGDYLAAHLLLIMLGREYCKARNPLHGSCPVNMLCPSAKMGG